MKKKSIQIFLCLLLVVIMSYTANAAYTSAQTASYTSGYNFPEHNGLSYQTKQTSSLGNNILSYNKTSWTTPKVGTCNRLHVYMTVLSPSKNSSTTPVCLTSMAECGQQYSVVIYGSGAQAGTDTMRVRFDLDANEARPVAEISPEVE